MNSKIKIDTISKAFSNPTPFLGYQTMVELYGCSIDKIDDENQVKSILLHMAEISDLTVVNSLIHHFSPIGVSGVVVIEESHIAVHTWPEYGYVALDFFTCNEQYDLQKGIEFVKGQFEASRIEVNHLSRGNINKIKESK